MSLSNEFKQLERRAYLAYHRDGIIDLILAWMILAIGLSEATDQSFWMLAGWFPTLFFLPLKNTITVPRFGYVRFNPDRGGVNRRALYIVMLVVLLFLVAGTALIGRAGAPPSTTVQWLKGNPLVFWAALSGIMLGVAGLATGIMRLLGYAALSIVLMIGSALFGFPPFAPFAMLSMVILVAGTTLLLRFLHDYPRPSGDSHNDTH